MSLCSEETSVFGAGTSSIKLSSGSLTPNRGKSGTRLGLPGTLGHKDHSTSSLQARGQVALPTKSSVTSGDSFLGRLLIHVSILFSEVANFWPDQGRAFLGSLRILACQNMLRNTLLFHCFSLHRTSLLHTETSLHTPNLQGQTLSGIGSQHTLPQALRTRS